MIVLINIIQVSAFPLRATSRAAWPEIRRGYGVKACIPVNKGNDLCSRADGVRGEGRSAGSTGNALVYRPEYSGGILCRVWHIGEGIPLC